MFTVAAICRILLRKSIHAHEVKTISLPNVCVTTVTTYLYMYLSISMCHTDPSRASVMGYSFLADFHIPNVIPVIYNLQRLSNRESHARNTKHHGTKLIQLAKTLT
mgnify:FL=1